MPAPCVLTGACCGHQSGLALPAGKLPEGEVQADDLLLSSDGACDETPYRTRRSGHLLAPEVKSPKKRCHRSLQQGAHAAG